MLARLLSILFPPRLPGRLRDWPEATTAARIITGDHGWAGNVRRKYRDGIDRHWNEPKKSA